MNLIRLEFILQPIIEVVKIVKLRNMGTADIMESWGKCVILCRYISKYLCMIEICRTCFPKIVTDL